MKKILAIALVAVMVLCLGVSAMAAGTYTVTLINGMDGSVHATYQVAAGEDFVFSISCASPADMGPVAPGEAGSGVTTTVGTITYSNITTGGPNAYPTAETVTISGINADATVTVTPNPLEVDSQFPTITEGAVAGGGGAASGEASGEASEDPYPMFEEYKAYLLETLLLDTFWQGNEATLRADLDAAETPDAECIQHFTGSGEVDQAPAGVVFPMTYDAWYAENGASGETAGDVFAAYIDYLRPMVQEGEFYEEFTSVLNSVTEATYDETAMPFEMFISFGALSYADFAAEYGAAAPAGGTSEADYQAYLIEFVNSCEDIQTAGTAGEYIALIEAGDYVSFPVEMLFNPQWFGEAALTLDEFVAAGGNVAVAAHPSNGAMLDGTTA